MIMTIPSLSLTIETRSSLENRAYDKSITSVSLFSEVVDSLCQREEAREEAREGGREGGRAWPLLVAAFDLHAAGRNNFSFFSPF